MICAGIKDNKVKAVIQIDSDEEYFSFISHFQNLIDISEQVPQPKVGWIVKGNHVVDREDSAIPSRITKLAFRSRFTAAEKAGMEAFAAQSNAYAYALRAAMGDQRDATFIDLSRQDTIGGVNQLVAMGLLTSQRASEILNNPVLEIEVYSGDK